MHVKWVHFKVVCGTSMYDYGSLRYVGVNVFVEALKSQAT